jgi:hypothetical protein
MKKPVLLCQAISLTRWKLRCGASAKLKIDDLIDAMSLVFAAIVTDLRTSTATGASSCCCWTTKPTSLEASVDEVTYLTHRTC